MFPLAHDKCVGQLKVLNSIPVCSAYCAGVCVFKRSCYVPVMAVVVYVQVNPATIAVISLYLFDQLLHMTWEQGMESKVCVSVCVCVS